MLSEKRWRLRRNSRAFPLGFRKVDAPFRRAAAHEDADDVAFPHVELEHISRIRLCVPKSGIAQAIHDGFAVVDALVTLLDL